MQNARLNEAQAGVKIAAVPGVAKSHTQLSDWTTTSIGVGYYNLGTEHKFQKKNVRNWIELAWAKNTKLECVMLHTFKNIFNFILEYSWFTMLCCSVAQSCPTLSNPMDCSTPGFPVLHHLLEFAQTQVHWVSNAIQPSHPLSSPSPPTFNLSQHQGLFQWASSSYQVAKVLELQLQHQSFQWIFRMDFLQDGLVWSCRPRISQESSPTPKFKSISSSVLNLLYGPTLTQWCCVSWRYTAEWFSYLILFQILFP